MKFYHMRLAPGDVVYTPPSFFVCYTSETSDFVVVRRGFMVQDKSVKDDLSSMKASLEMHGDARAATIVVLLATHLESLAK